MWEKVKKSILLLLFAVCLLGFLHQKKIMREVSPDEKNELIKYLQSNWETPENYIISKFHEYDIVFIGEGHHIKHDVELIQNLIPFLYKNGVYNLGIEFGCYEYQDKVDSLITAESYDEDLGRWLLFKWGSYWPYKEYMDLYKKAWELNESLSKDEPKFRIVNLDYRAKWNLVTEGMPSSRWKKVFYKGERDEHMAKIIFKEIVKKEQKALIFAGQQHSATHYYHPEYNFENKKLVGFNKKRMGNLVYREIPDKIFNICLHYPWPTLESLTEFNYPVRGVIDTIMKEFEDKKVGFDVRDTPFGKLRDDSTFYSAGYDTFILSDFCDGYVFQKHIEDYEGCTVDPLFVTEDNLKEAIDYLPNPRLKKVMKSPQQFLSFLRLKVNMKRKFGDFE